MRRLCLWFAAAFALMAVVLLLPTSQAASDTGCLVLNQRTHQVFKTLQAGIDAAKSADTLNVVGTCHGISTINLDLTLKGVGFGQVGATLDGDHQLDAVLTIGANVTISNLAITGGARGGIANTGTLRLVRSAVSGNTSERSGAGIFNYGTVVLDHSLVTGNTSDFVGGGILNGDTEFSHGIVSLVDSTVSGNKAAEAGGGIYNTTGLVTLANSKLVDNTSGSSGGGILSRGKLTLSGSAVAGNSANANGGGIGNLGGSVALTDSTVRNNRAHNIGGGIFHNSGTLTLTHSAVRDNTASAGGGIFNQSGKSEATLTDSTVSGNRATDGPGGGIYNDDLLNLDNSTVNKNTATGSGIDIFSIGTLTLRDNR